MRPRVIAAGAGVLLLVGCTANQLLTYLTDSLFSPPFSTFVQRLSPASAGNSSFGTSVDVDGDYVIVGAPNAAGGGAAWIFERQEDGSFDDGTKLTASDATAEDEFGSDVGISGDWVVVGAPDKDVTVNEDGGIYIFERVDGSTWAQRESFDLASIGDPTQQDNDQLGYRVAIHDEWIAATARQDDLESGSANDNFGAVYMFRRSGGTWSYESRLDPGTTSTMSAKFGEAVTITADEILIGAFQEPAGALIDAGAAYSYEWIVDEWELVDKFRAPTPEDDGGFGLAVALSNDHAVVGDLSTQDGSIWAGAAFVFQRGPGGNWDATPGVQILPAASATLDFYGSAVGITGSHLLLGAPNKDDHGDDSGAAFLFERSGDGVWQNAGELLPPDLEAGTHLGRAIAMNEGGLAVIGATDPFTEDEPGGDGAVYVYE